MNRRLDIMARPRGGSEFPAALVTVPGFCVSWNLDFSHSSYPFG
jgi:hypothetical protein